MRRKSLDDLLWFIYDAKAGEYRGIVRDLARRHQYLAEIWEDYRKAEEKMRGIIDKLAGDKVTERFLHVLACRARGMSLAAIGRDLGITRERARQLEAKARRRIEKLWAQSQEVAVVS